MKKGFTLVEIVVVMAVIGIILTLTLIGLQGSQRASRDNNRKALIDQVNQRLQVYYQANGSYPTSLTGGTLPFNCSNYSAGCFQADNGCLSSNQVSINNSCMSLNGLTYTSVGGGLSALCNTKPSPFNTGQFYMCYIAGTGSNGYTLGTWLEGNSSAYLIAK